jgi:hypothetical protein
MARKNQHTFAKRQREQKKREKLIEKQARRDERRGVQPDESLDSADGASGDDVVEPSAQVEPPAEEGERSSP